MPVVGGIPAANALVADSNIGTITAECTAIMGRLAVGAKAAIVA
jgi:hypothetical protein